MKVTEVIGWVYEAPRDKVRQADQDLEDWQDEDYISDLEATRDAEIEVLQDRIDLYDRYIQSLNWRKEEAERIERDRLLMEMLNVDTEAEIRDKLLDDIEHFNVECEGNYKNYIGISENYSDFNDFYINKMMDLDAKYEKIINNTDLTVVNNSKFAKFFRKVKAILTANVELSK